MNPLIESLYARGEATGKSGAKKLLHSEIDPAEGRFLHKIVSEDPSISNTLEIGCAFGMSSLHICDALRPRSNPRHTIIDPFEFLHWDGVGIKNLEESGIDFFQLIEEGSEIALPKLLPENEGKFDLIFVDGWHTFDHTLLDCFYATRLLKIGGYLVIDDVGMISVRRATEYVASYPCYRVQATLDSAIPFSLKWSVAKTALSLIPASHRARMVHPTFLHRALDDHSPRMLALKKVAPDERTWDWFPKLF